MRHNKILYIITGALLLYFFFFIIPPLSALAAFDDDFVTLDDAFSLNTSQARPGMYAIDILIWAELEESDNQDTLSNSSTDYSLDCCYDHNVVVCDADFQSYQELQITPFLVHTYALPRSGHFLSRSSGFRLELSGISPPVLS